MADPTSIPQISVGEDIKDPAAKRPCLEPVSNTLEPGVETPLDEGSDFYNTPLIPGTPVRTAEKASTEDIDSILPSPSKPTMKIPGLSFVNLSSEPAWQQQPEASIATAGTVDKVLEGNTVEQPKKQASPARDVEMGETSPGDNQQRNEQGEDTHMEEPKAEVASTVSETINGDTTAEQNSVPESATETPNGAGGAEVGPDHDENPEWELDSSPYESSSDSSSDSSDEDSSSDDEYNLLGPEEQARILMAAEGGSDDEGDGKYKGAYVRTANEKPDEIVPKPDITVTPEMKVEMLGNVEAIVDNVILIKANISGEYQVLEAGSVLCLADLDVIGAVSETLGRVEQPLYTVRFPNADAIKESKLEKGTPVFYVVDHSTFVFTQPLKGLKGSDASNFHDEEVGDDEIEFSDDEAEAEYKRQQKQKRQQKRDGPGKPRRDLPGPSRLRNSEINYDDVPMQDGYTPLARPKNLHEMMGPNEAPTEEFRPRPQFSERGSRGGRGRGRGRGSDRGGRGRGRGGGYHQHGDDRQRQYSPQQDSAPAPNYPPHPPQTFYRPQSPQQQQPASPYNQPYNQQFFPNQYPQQHQPPQPYNANPNIFASMPAPVQNFPFQQSYQPNAPSYPPPGSYINPAFFRNQQQSPQQQQQQQQQQHQAPSQQPPQYSAPPAGPSKSQSSADTFAAAQAQLDLLRKLSRGGS
ncbi:hypothetical protein FQN50_003283 [Emmonsiellopsis sp. PD_5]|nr:hypothetical protein FQN50_003283 [Emmonsiellopsis sp. PD_5]